MTLRTLPVLDVPTPRGPSAAPPTVAPEVVEYVAAPESLPRFFIWTLGCQMNHSDSEQMAGSLLAAGCEASTSLEDAALLVINTCAIREAAEQKVIGRMGQLAALKRERPGTRVVLTGCSVREDNRATLGRRYPAVDLFLRPDEEPELAERLGLMTATSPGWLGAHTTRSADAAEYAHAPTTTVRVGRSIAATADRLPQMRAAAVARETIHRERTWDAWVPIVYGCDKTCTYCIVPFSRGPERSRPFDDVLAECRVLGENGVKNVTLLGQNVNSYGHDLPPDDRFDGVDPIRPLGRRLDMAGRPDFAALLRAVDALRLDDGRRAIPRLRFVTSHPWDLTDRLVGALAECPSVCEHLHLPVQSGDDAVLHRMGRQYDAESYLRLLEKVRAAVPGIAISTDVIVGFCGESDAQFERTLDLLRALRYDQVFAAAYSVRPGTPAARLDDDVPAGEKRRRLNALLELQEGIGWELNRAWVGRTTEVLVDQVDRPSSHGDGEEASSRSPRVAGRNRENKLVHFAGAPDLVGRLVDVRIEQAGPYSLQGVALGPATAA